MSPSSAGGLQYASHSSLQHPAPRRRDAPPSDPELQHGFYAVLVALMDAVFAYGGQQNWVSAGLRVLRACRMVFGTLMMQHPADAASCALRPRHWCRSERCLHRAVCPNDAGKQERQDGRGVVSWLCFLSAQAMRLCDPVLCMCTPERWTWDQPACGLCMQAWHLCTAHHISPWRCVPPADGFLMCWAGAVSERRPQQSGFQVLCHGSQRDHDSLLCCPGRHRLHAAGDPLRPVAAHHLSAAPRWLDSPHEHRAAGSLYTGISGADSSRPLLEEFRSSRMGCMLRPCHAA